MTRFLLLYVAPPLLILAVAISSLVTGSQTLFHRDVLTSHYPIKAAHAQVMDEGNFLPLIDPYRFGGQPLLGNPNAVPFFPTNLFYRLASPLWALNAHFWLHWLLAPFAVFWLGRAWGLSRPAAWAGGLVYASSGYFLSLLNFYNLVTGAVWMPAFAAACLQAAKSRSVWPSISLALTWSLLILSGDPMTALLGLLLGTSAWLAARPSQFRRAATSMLASLAAGTLIAAPMWVELFRILPTSYRGTLGYSIRTSLAQSWNPWTSIEWIVPFCFGNLDYNFWGYSFFGGNPPLFYSLFPGVLAVGLVVASRRPSTMRDFWCWAWIAGGAFISAGYYNPFVHLLYKLPGASSLRYPIKCWILVAIAASILAGVGFDRFLKGDRLLVKILGACSSLYLLLWGLLIFMPAPLEQAIRSLNPEVLSGPMFGHQRLQWATSTFFVLTACLMLWLTARQVRRRSPLHIGAVLLFIHFVSQSFLLHPLFESDDASIYTNLPEIATELPADARVAHGTFGELFGPRDQAMFSKLPGAQLFWLTQEDFVSFGHYAGVSHGYKYELNFSPEGLDSFQSRALGEALKGLDDLSRIRLLAAVGTDRLLLTRELDSAAEPEVQLIAKAQGPTVETRHYAIERTLPELQVVGTIMRVGNMSEAVHTIAEPAFDPRVAAVLHTEGPPLNAEPGDAELIAESLERMEVRVSSEQGGLLTTRRAWLPLYRAFIDDEPADVEIFNVYKMGVMVPPGDHRVMIETDRRPTYTALAASILAALFLVLAAFQRVSSDFDSTPDDPNKDPSTSTSELDRVTEPIERKVGPDVERHVIAAPDTLGAEKENEAGKA